MQAKVGLISFLANYEVRGSEKTPIPVVLDDRSVILSAKGGMWLTIVNRQTSTESRKHFEATGQRVHFSDQLQDGRFLTPASLSPQPFRPALEPILPRPTRSVRICRIKLILYICAANGMLRGDLYLKNFHVLCPNEFISGQESLLCTSR